MSKTNPTTQEIKYLASLDVVRSDGFDRTSPAFARVTRSMARDMVEMMTEKGPQVPAADVQDFQDRVRAYLLKLLADRHIRAEIDGGGCDSGDWRDFTLSEIGQGFNALDDHRHSIVQQALRLASERERLRGLLGDVLASLSAIDQSMPDIARRVVHGAFIYTEQAIRAELANP